MQSWRQRKLQKLLEPSPFAATQAVKGLVKFATALLMRSCGGSFQTVCGATFNPSVVAG